MNLIRYRLVLALAPLAMAGGCHSSDSKLTVSDTSTEPVAAPLSEAVKTSLPPTPTTNVARTQQPAADCIENWIKVELADMPISKARERLISEGWKPAASESDSRSDRALSFIKRGWTEADDCSGSVGAFCRFSYSRGPQRLAVITTGEEPSDGQVDDDPSVESLRCE